MVYFLEDKRIGKNLLEKERLAGPDRFGLIDHHQSVYVAEYDFEPDPKIQ